MKSVAIACLAAVLVAFAALPTHAAERLNDKQVKATLENIDRGFDRWKDSLERRNLDDAVIRNAAGTIEVRRFLDDFEKEIHQVKDRLKPDYAANPEVTQLLRRASDVERRAQASSAQPEWQAMATQFSALAAAYGTSFPLPTADAAAARLTDRELASHVSDIEQQAKRLSSEGDKALKQAKASDVERNKAKQASSALAVSAKQTASMANAGTVNGTQAASLLAAAGSAKGLLGGLPMSPAGAAALSGLNSSAGAVAKAFGLPW